MSLALLVRQESAPASQARNPVGRPFAAADPHNRKKWLTIAAKHYLCGHTIPRLAVKHKVSLRTISLWIAKALDFDDERALALRKRREQTGRAIAGCRVDRGIEV